VHFMGDIVHLTAASPTHPALMPPNTGGARANRRPGPAEPSRVERAADTQHDKGGEECGGGGEIRGRYKNSVAKKWTATV